jgi:hypothetical protein
MEQKYKKFLEYNWKDSAEWQLYLSNLSEVPPGNKVEHFKKRFYKFKVDHDFDVKWVPQENTTNNNTYQRANAHQHSFTSQPGPSNPIGGNILAIVEVIVWGIFLITALIQIHTLKFASLALLIRVIRRIGLPKFSMEYAQMLFLDEHFQQLLYVVLFMIDRLNFFTIVPVGITAVLNISEFIRTKPAIFRGLLPYANKIINKRVELALMRANTEVGIGFLLFIGIFMGINSFILPIFYWQYLRFKYIVNNDIKLSFSKLNSYIDNIKNKPNTPGLLKLILTKIQEFASYLGRTEAAPGQPAGGANCNIF